MTIQNSGSKQPAYPKKHIIAASGIAALVSLVLIVFPSKEVVANKAFIDLLPLENDDPLVPEQSFAAQLNSPEAISAALLSATDVRIADEPQPEAAEQPQQDIQDSEHSSQQPRSVTVTVQSGDTLSGLFDQLELGHSLMNTILAQDKQARQFTQLRLGQELEFGFDASGELYSISSQLNPLERIHLTRNEESSRFLFGKDVQETTLIEAHAGGTIDSSLFAATSAAGMPYRLAHDMANIFAYDIDFARDLREGDNFEVVYQQRVLGDQVMDTGNILAARFTNKGKTLTAIRYTDKQGNTAYYNSDGTSNRKAFIRTPVDFSRISSKFNPGRKHPILNRIRAHKGVDYAAPTGTPIKATGNGKIAFIGNKSGYGKTIVIQHGNQYRTLYGHMNGYAKGLRNGSPVTQGQIIGYVGMTGLATGPHLHYEFHVNGVHVDPLSQKLPTSDPVPRSEMARFQQAAKPLLARLDEQRSIRLARADTTDR